MDENRDEIIEQTDTEIETEQEAPVTRDDDALTQVLQEIVAKLDELIKNTNKPAPTPMPGKIEGNEPSASIYDM